MPHFPARVAPLVILVAGACTHLRSRHAATTAPEPVVATIVSNDFRLWNPRSALRIVVRDVDAPDKSIPEARILISRAHRQPAQRDQIFAILGEGRGLGPVSLDSDDYVVQVRYIGYESSRFTVHLRANCEQVLEVYATRAEARGDRVCLAGAASTSCPAEPSPTPARAVLTTCASSD